MFIACDDPYETAELFTGPLGWRLVFATPRDGADKLACVALGDDQLMLGTSEERFVPRQSRLHRGAGVTIYIRLPAGEDIAAIHARHAAARVVTTALSQRDFGALAFNAVINGYQFLIAQDDPAAAAR